MAAELPEAVQPAVAAEPRAALAVVAGQRVAAAVQVSEAPLSAAAVLHAALEPLTLAACAWGGSADLTAGAVRGGDVCGGATAVGAVRGGGPGLRTCG